MKDNSFVSAAETDNSQINDESFEIIDCQELTDVLPTVSKKSSRHETLKRRIFLIPLLLAFTTIVILTSLVIILLIVDRKDQSSSQIVSSEQAPLTDSSGGSGQPSNLRPVMPTTLNLSPEVSSKTLEPTPVPTQQSCPISQISMPPLPGKKGVGFTLRDEGLSGSWLENIPKVIALNPYWNYSWGLKRVAAQPESVEFVPMIWGGKNEKKLQAQLLEDLQPQVENGSAKRLLAFNEPENAAQSNMTTLEAIAAWSILEATQLPLVSPSPAQANGEWMKSFMKSAEELCLDVRWVGVHWYGGTNVESFKSRMVELYQLYRKPLLITEFAPTDWRATTAGNNTFTDNEVLIFMKKALPWLERQDFIMGYSWFSFARDSPQGTHSALFDETGNLTPMGRYYASVRTDSPDGDLSITSD